MGYDMAYGQAIALAAEKLSRIADFEAHCRKSDSVCRKEGSSRMVALKYLNHPYQVDLPDMQVSQLDSAEPVELRDKILILHYLTEASGIPLSGHLIAYQELKEGTVYYPTFIKRSVKPLIDCFGGKPELLLEAAAELGGVKTDLGDLAVTIPAFSRVPITLVMWRGDEEFPPDANILFDNTVLDYLAVEDLNVLCQTISWRLVKTLAAHSNSK